jgi:hypothetical protein
LKYGGEERCDEFAMKVANLELQGLTHYSACNISKLHFPLMAIIDYKGFRLLAVSVLPSKLCS